MKCITKKLAKKNFQKWGEILYLLSTFIHPGRWTWNLQITHLERKMIFQTSMIVVHVNLPGCNIGGLQPLSPSRPWGPHAWQVFQAPEVKQKGDGFVCSRFKVHRVSLFVCVRVRYVYIYICIYRYVYIYICTCLYSVEKIYVQL